MVNTLLFLQFIIFKMVEALYREQMYLDCGGLVPVTG